MRPDDQFHVGIVVNDFEAALAELTRIFGYTWCPEMALPQEVQLPTGRIVADLRFTYSASTPRVEVIQSVPGTPWVTAPGSGIHHLGYWSDDVPADSAALDRSGYRMEAAGTRPDGSPYWAYHRAPYGPRIEIVSRDLQGGLQQYWDTGRP